MTGYQSKKAAAQAKLAQSAQEPVAWKHPDKNMVFWKDTKEMDEYHGFKPTIPLYTTPPQRPWVEPTGNEWFEWWRVSQVANETEAEIDFADFLIITQAVAAKLKEKNNE